MDLEIQVAVQFILSFLTGKFSKDKEKEFMTKLRELLITRFSGHWYPEKPTKGSAYRCISVENNQLDAVLIKAGELCVIIISDLSACLPKKLDLWIDPTEVSYRIGEHGPVTIIYKEGDDCVNSTSVHLKKVLDRLPTVSPPPQQKKSTGTSNISPKSFSKRNNLSGSPLMNLQQQVANNINIAAAQRRLENQLNPKPFLGRNNLQNLAFLQNQALTPTFNPLLMNMEYLQKLQWLASGAYDPLGTAQVVQNILIMQELQRFETRRLALQSHYMKLQGMKWSKKGTNNSGKHSSAASHATNGLQMSA